MIDLFSFCRDQEMFPEGETYDEVLANVMLYRYEHNISILDDEYSIKTIDYVLRLLTMQEVLKVEFPPNAEEKRRKRKISLPKNIQKNIRLY